ncbi:unnamed protein product [Symbiodinium sp. KB8]|nr:unnamed protein product [Symbiodinium sp. KB8]
MVEVFLDSLNFSTMTVLARGVLALDFQNLLGGISCSSVPPSLPYSCSTVPIAGLLPETALQGCGMDSLNGSACPFNCTNGLSGTGQLTCVNGSWVVDGADPPRCIPPCQNIPGEEDVRTRATLIGYEFGYWASPTVSTTSTTTTLPCDRNQAQTCLEAVISITDIELFCVALPGAITCLRDTSCCLDAEQPIEGSISNCLDAGLQVENACGKQLELDETCDAARATASCLAGVPESMNSNESCLELARAPLCLFSKSCCPLLANIANLDAHVSTCASLGVYLENPCQEEELPIANEGAIFRETCRSPRVPADDSVSEEDYVCKDGSFSLLGASNLTCVDLPCHLSSHPDGAYDCVLDGQPVPLQLVEDGGYLLVPLGAACSLRCDADYQQPVPSVEYRCAYAESAYPDIIYLSELVSSSAVPQMVERSLSGSLQPLVTSQVCMDINCTLPTLDDILQPSILNISCTGISYNSTCAPVCAAGYESDGHELRCAADGQFQGFLRCLPPASEDDEIHNKHSQRHPDPPCYDPDPEASRYVCEASEWRIVNGKSTPCIEKSCPEAPQIWNALPSSLLACTDQKRRQRARARLHQRRRAQRLPRASDLHRLLVHHTQPKLREVWTLGMGGKKWNQWPKQQREIHGYEAHGYDTQGYEHSREQPRWRVWHGAWPKQDKNAPPARYDQYATDDANVDYGSYGPTAEEPASSDALRLMGIQKAVNQARRSDVKIRKLKEEKLRRTKQWDLYAADMRAKYLKQQQMYQQDMQRLDQEEAATILAGKEAAQLVQSIALNGVAPQTAPTGPDAWDALLSESGEAVTRDGFLWQALMAARGTSALPLHATFPVPGGQTGLGPAMPGVATLGPPGAANVGPPPGILAAMGPAMPDNTRLPSNTAPAPSEAPAPVHPTEAERQAMEHAYHQSLKAAQGPYQASPSHATMVPSPVPAPVPTMPSPGHRGSRPPKRVSIKTPTKPELMPHKGIGLEAKLEDKREALRAAQLAQAAPSHPEGGNNLLAGHVTIYDDDEDEEGDEFMEEHAADEVPVPEPQPPEVWPDFRAVPDYMEVFQCFFDVLLGHKVFVIGRLFSLDRRSLFRLQSRASWFSCPLGLVQQPTATLMLGSGVCRIFVPALAQGSSLTEAAAEFVGQDASRITCAMPSLGRLADLRLDGTPCKDVMAVHNALPPDPDTPPGYCIFLDSRQVGRIPTFVWLWRNEVDMGYLARAAGVHRIPVGYHLSLANARPSLRENHIWVSSGDTLVFGFRNEEDSDLSSGAGTDGDDNAPEDSETSTRPPDTEPDDGSPLQHAQQMPSDDPPDRNISPLLLGLDELFSDQNTFVPGSCPVTPMLSNGSCIATDLKASPPTLQQRLERPLGGWRDTPGAEHAPENEEELDTIDAFTGPHIDDDPESSDSEEEAPATAVFLVLSVDCIPEQVEIELAPHMSVQEALDAVNDCRPHHRYLLFPRICPASPQPTRHWGVLIASPAWAEAERIACCDSRSIDGRLFALIVPIAATRGQLCRLAGLPDDGSVNVFPYGAIQPLGADDLADYVVGGTIIFSHRPLLSRVGFRLDQLLAMQYAWDLDPDLPSGPIGYHYCTAFEGGHRRVTHDRLTDHNVCDAIARSEAMSVAQFSIQHATPRITDCAVLGYHCQDVIAVIPHEAWPDGARPTPVLLDCRAIHQGWALYLAEDCRVSHSSLIYDLDTFVPAGWQVQLDPIDIDDGYFTVAPGMVLVVSYVPLSSDEELLPDQPWDGFHGQDSRDDSSSDEEDAASDGAGEPPPGRTPAQTERSRSRSPQAHTERSAKTRPHCQHNVALFFLRIVLGICWLGGHGASLLVICSLWSFAGDPRGVGVLRPLVLVSLLGCGMLPAAGVQVQMQGLFRPHGHCFSDDMSLPTPATDRVYRDLPHGGGAPVEGCLWLHHSAHRPLPTPCRAFLRDAPLDIGETQTLLEESLSKPDSQALFLASTLLEVLFEHFGLAVSPVAPRALAPATSPVRISLQDSLPAPVVAPTVSLCEPEIYDLDALQCLLPGRSDVFLELFGRLPFSSLQPAPQGLEKPWRFSDWLACGCPGRSPGPGHTLVITSDGSYRAQDHAAGWGLSVSILQLGYDSLPGQFVGCLYGPMQPFLTYLGCPGAVDAYSAEVAGLLWSAVVALQLPVVCPVVLRSDNVAALHGVQGLCGMRSSPLCLAARSLHAALAIRLATLVSYAHVRGHTGDFANELSDALAALGALGHSRTSPFAFDVEHFLQNSAAAAQWLPHICLTSLRPNELPALRGQLMSWSVDEGACHHAPGHSMRPFLRAFPAAAATPPGASVEHIGFSLCLVSYNVLSLSDGARDAQQGLHGAVGRPTLLQQSLSEFGAHVIGLQECRTPQGRARIGSYTRFCSGCDAKSCFGVELWVSDTGPCAASSVVVFHTSPTILIAGAKIGELPVRVLVGHAPHRGHTAEFRKAWWDATSGLCHSFAHGCPWLFLLDANCRVGSIVSCAVGGHQADEEDDAGASFHSLILSLQISLPATFYVHMQGPGGTLLQKRNGALERSDFIGVPQDWLSGRCSARVEPGVTSGHACADHFAAMLEVHLTLCQSLPKQARAARIDARAIGDPQNAAAVSEIIRSAPRPAWEIDASEHAAEVVDYLYLGLVARFPLKRKPMRAHFFTETTVALHRAVAALRHAVRARSSALHFTYLRCAWLGDHLRSPLSLPFRATGCGNCARG